MIQHGFIFDGNDSTKLGMTFYRAPELSPPQPRLTKISVPGKSGDYTQWAGDYDNRTLTLYCNLIAPSYANAMAAVNRVLLVNPGYHKLELSTDNDHYLLAQLQEGGEQTPISREIGQFTLKFDCQPQRWLKEGTLNINVQGEYQVYPASDLYPGNDTYPYSYTAHIDNPGFDSMPEFTLYGTGDAGYIEVNGQRIAISRVPATGIVIDCQIKDVYAPDGQENLNYLVTIPDDEWPTLPFGQNEIVWSENLVKLTIKPRWYDL